MWDLATLKAEWLPSLYLQHNSLAWAATSINHFFRPHAVGVVHCQGHLLVYCSFSLDGQCVLCVYRYDPGARAWSKFALKTLELPVMGRGGADAVFTPMPRATARRRFEGDDEREIWLYGSVDLASGSLFLRLQPLFADNTVRVEFLPLPEFVLRAYNLVAVDIPQRQKKEASSTPTSIY